MANNEIVKTLKVDTATGTKSVKDLKKEINDLRDALLNVEKGSNDWQDITKRLVEAQTELKDVMNAGKQTMDAAEDSIVGMERKYKSLYDTYKLLTDEQRKTPFGKEMAKDLNDLSKKLNETKKNVGNFKDNIGHYAESMVDAFGQLGISVGGLQKPIQMVNKGFNLLKANPIMAVLAVLVGLFIKVKDAISSNEELQLRLNKAMAAFKPIGDIVATVLDKIAGVAVSVAEGLAKVVGWVSSLFEKTKQLTEAETELANIENDLITKRREYGELNAVDEARIAQLREEVSLSTDKAEIEEKLKEAKELQIKVNERNVELAELEYEAIKKKNAITPSSTEDLNKESEALQKVNAERAKGEMAVRKLNSGIKSATANSINGLKEIKSKYEELKTAFEGEKEGDELSLSFLPFPSRKWYEEKIAISEKYIGYYVDAINKKLGTNFPTKNPFAEYADIMNAFDAASDDVKNDILNILNAKPGINIKDINNLALSYKQLLNDYTNLQYESEDYESILIRLNEQIKEHAYQLDNLETHIQEYPKKAAEYELNTQLQRYTNAQRNIEIIFEEIKAMKDRGANEQELLEKGMEFIDAKIAKEEIELEWTINKNDAIIESNEGLRESYENLHYTAIDSIDSLIESTKQLIELDKASGDMTEKQAERKRKALTALEAVQLAVSLASIVGDTAMGLTKLNEAQASELAGNSLTAAGTGVAYAGTKLGLDSATFAKYKLEKISLITQGATAAVAAISKSVAAINGLRGQAGSGNASTGANAGAMPQIIESNPYSYTRQVQTNAEREDMLNQAPVYVKVVDIENGLNASRIRNAEVTF